jgi:putative oxidoreductase
MNYRNTDIGTLILRVSLGLVLLAHSVYLKAVVFTLPGTAAYFASIGLPALSAYVVFLVEAVAGIGLILSAMAVAQFFLGAGAYAIGGLRNATGRSLRRASA